MKRLFLIFTVSIFLFSGCENNNIFGGAYDSSLNASYESLMIDADAYMSRKDYSNASKYYEAALNKKQGNPEAALGYSTAIFYEVIGEQYGNMLNAVISGGNTSTDLLGFLNGGLSLDSRKTRLHSALGKMLGSPAEILILSRNPNADVNLVLNAAIAQFFWSILEVYDNSELSFKIKIKENYTVEVDSSYFTQARTLRNNLQVASDMLSTPASKYGGIMNDILGHIGTLIQNINTAIGD